MRIFELPDGQLINVDLVEAANAPAGGRAVFSMASGKEVYYAGSPDATEKLKQAFKMACSCSDDALSNVTNGTK